jgi:hypothetical protein
MGKIYYAFIILISVYLIKSTSIISKDLIQRHYFANDEFVDFLDHELLLAKLIDANRQTIAGYGDDEFSLRKRFRLDKRYRFDKRSESLFMSSEIEDN